MNERLAKCVVSSKEEESRIDLWLSKRFTYHSRSKWQMLISSGKILLNSEEVKVSTRIKSGDSIEYKIPLFREPEVSFNVEIVYEDDHLLIINKPGNLPCHPGGKYFQHTLWHQLKNSLQEFWIVNRLDRETSGLVLISKTLQASRFISKQFKDKKIKKRYLVLIEGRFPINLRVTGFLEASTGDVIRKRRWIVDGPGKDRDYVDTYFHKIQERNGLSLLVAFPKTGKTHQIRASLRSRGFPVVGDKIYGCVEGCFLRFIGDGLNKNDIQNLKMPRQALHALSLSFQHPISGEKKTCFAPIPSDFREFLQSNGFDLHVLPFSSRLTPVIPPKD